MKLKFIYAHNTYTADDSCLRNTHEKSLFLYRGFCWSTRRQITLFPTMVTRHRQLNDRAWIILKPDNSRADNREYNVLRYE